MYATLFKPRILVPSYAILDSRSSIQKTWRSFSLCPRASPLQANILTSAGRPVSTKAELSPLLYQISLVLNVFLITICGSAEVALLLYKGISHLPSIDPTMITSLFSLHNTSVGPLRSPPPSPRVLRHEVGVRSRFAYKARKIPLAVNSVSICAASFQSPTFMHPQTGVIHGHTRTPRVGCERGRQGVSGPKGVV